MFIRLSALEPGFPKAVPRFFQEHPLQISRWLEELWAAGPPKIELPTTPPPITNLEPKPFIGDEAIIAALARPGKLLQPAGIDPLPAATDPLPKFTDNASFPAGSRRPVWHHLIYAYLLENTGMVEIFAEVVRRAVVGETLEVSDRAAVQWLRTTEELFFRDPPLFSISSITSHLRPEARVVRRNAYWRMFGMDLSHDIPPRWLAPMAGLQAWKQDTGPGVNTAFRAQWAELLRQVWLGQENRKNTSGANSTDDAYLLLLCDSLRDMMNMRRRGASLAREEFVSVATASWFEETLQFDTPIVSTLKASAESPADRLALVARAVGMAPAPRSRELFELAHQMSMVLRIIEAGVLDNTNISRLYDDGPFARQMNNIIDLWQSATGERVKDRPAGNVVTTAPAQPLRIPAPQPLTLARSAGTGGRP